VWVSGDPSPQATVSHWGEFLGVSWGHCVRFPQGSGLICAGGGEKTGKPLVCSKPLLCGRVAAEEVVWPSRDGGGWQEAAGDVGGLPGAVPSGEEDLVLSS